VVKHDPFVFFDDVTGSNNPADAYCIAHVRPYSELASDLSNNTVARYNFITPNVCHDMHDSCAPLNDEVKQGDVWLSTEVPRILASQPYAAKGVLFITWDEAKTGDGPIGMIVLSPVAKGGVYSNRIQYTHSSTLRTVEEIFVVSPLHGAGSSRAPPGLAGFPAARRGGRSPPPQALQDRRLPRGGARPGSPLRPSPQPTRRLVRPPGPPLRDASFRVKTVRADACDQI